LKERDKYNWSDAAKDIALMTDLTLAEASSAVEEVRDLLHPHDSLVSLVALFEAKSPTRQARALARLLESVIE
jgi:hypothetical protein